LHVPFVDPLSAMLDRGNPLTTVEYEEWGGDPLADRDSFLYLQQLSPYDQLLKLQNTTGGVLPPSIYMTAGRLDRRVAYWQPLKYAARLRNAFSDYRNGGGDGRKLLLTVREHGGHFGDTTEAGEEETARWLAFLILQS
jgi:oligopeptidase B